MVASVLMIVAGGKLRRAHWQPVHGPRVDHIAKRRVLSVGMEAVQHRGAAHHDLQLFLRLSEAVDAGGAQSCCVSSNVYSMGIPSPLGGSIRSDRSCSSNSSGGGGEERREIFHSRFGSAATG